MLFAFATAGCDQPQAPPAEVNMQEAAPAPAPEPAPAPTIVADFKSVDTWQSLGGGAAPEGLGDDGFVLGPMAGTMSRNILPATPGAKYVVDYSVSLVSPPKNGKPAAYVVGPLFLDDKGAVLSWGNVELPLTEEKRDGRVEMEAPAGAVTVQIYIGGMWAADEPTPDGSLKYTSAKLVAPAS
jgi:hypothetical protein